MEFWHTTITMKSDKNSKPFPRQVIQCSIFYELHICILFPRKHLFVLFVIFSTPHFLPCMFQRSRFFFFLSKINHFNQTEVLKLNVWWKIPFAPQSSLREQFVSFLRLSKRTFCKVKFPKNIKKIRWSKLITV